MLKLRLNFESYSYGIMIFTNLPSEFINHWNINSYMENTRQHQQEQKKQVYQKGLKLAKKKIKKV